MSETVMSSLQKRKVKVFQSSASCIYYYTSKLLKPEETSKVIKYRK